jgi:MFS family permease
MRNTTYRNYLLAVLTVIALFNYVDRTALGLVLQNIKTDLQLSDTQLGFLSGIAFALFYSVMGVPIARWADRGNRVTIITLTTALWSVAVALCGVATSFTQLLLTRVAVAVGEAGCIPPAFSLIADYFNRGERPRASAIYGLAGVFSAVIGYFVAGWLNEFYGWRVTFVCMGAPGVALALLAWFTLREPRRQLTTASGGGQGLLATGVPQQPSLKEVRVTLWRSRTFVHLQLCLAVMYFFNYGIGQWLPSFFVRSYGLSTGVLGTWFTVIVGPAGALGMYLGGEWASRRGANNESLQLKVVAVAIIVAGALMVPAYLTHNMYLSFLLMALSSVGLAIANGPVFATIQTLIPERMRAVAFAIVYLTANLVGMGLGPLAAGVLSDFFREWAGQESLRYSLLALVPGYSWVGWHAWQASRSVARELASVPSAGSAAASRGEVYQNEDAMDEKTAAAARSSQRIGIAGR